MTFTVTYRGANGAPVTETVEAADRADCLARLKARGIAATSVKEGAKPGRDGRDRKDSAKSCQRRRSIVPYVVSVALVAFVVGGIWWWLGRDKARPSQDDEPARKKTALAKEVTPAAAPKPVAEVPKPVATNEMVKAPAPAPWRNSKLSEEERLEAYSKSLEESPLPATSTNRLFRSGVEQVMGWIFTTEVGELPPPLPRVPDFDLVHLQEILDSKCEIGESDSDRQAETKGIVDFAKAELKKYIEKGGAPDEFLKYYHDQLKTAHQHRQIVQDQMMKVLQEEPERAEEYLRDANKGLAKMGIKEVVIPERIRRRLGLTN